MEAEEVLGGGVVEANSGHRGQVGSVTTSSEVLLDSKIHQINKVDRKFSSTTVNILENVL